MDASLWSPSIDCRRCGVQRLLHDKWQDWIMRRSINWIVHPLRIITVMLVLIFTKWPSLWKPTETSKGKVSEAKPFVNAQHYNIQLVSPHESLASRLLEQNTGEKNLDFCSINWKPSGDSLFPILVIVKLGYGYPWEYAKMNLSSF